MLYYVSLQTLLLPEVCTETQFVEDNTLDDMFFYW